jgi:hypothetical protein
VIDSSQRESSNRRFHPQYVQWKLDSSPLANVWQSTMIRAVASWRNAGRFSSVISTSSPVAIRRSSATEVSDRSLASGGSNRSLSIRSSASRSRVVRVRAAVHVLSVHTAKPRTPPSRVRHRLFGHTRLIALILPFAGAVAETDLLRRRSQLCDWKHFRHSHQSESPYHGNSPRRRRRFSHKERPMS